MEETLQEGTLMSAKVGLLKRAGSLRSHTGHNIIQKRQRTYLKTILFER